MNETNGIVFTRLGLNLIAKWGAGSDRVLADMMVGSGKVNELTILQELTDLITPVAQATSTLPYTVDNQIQFSIQYRNIDNPEIGGFFLSEFGVFAIDPDIGRILLCYGNLGDFPEWIHPFSSGIESIRDFHISIGVSGDGNVILSYPAKAFLTADSIIMPRFVNDALVFGR